jgi:hypothetical protein
VGFVLATTLLPNVLSDIQVGHAQEEKEKKLVIVCPNKKIK